MNEELNKQQQLNNKEEVKEQQQETQKQESKSDYAFAKLRVENKSLTEKLEKLAESNEKLLEKLNSLQRSDKQEQLKKEFLMQGGKKEAFEAFCKLNSNLLDEADANKSKELFNNAKKEYSYMFNKTVINNNLAYSIGANTNVFKEEQTKENNKRYTIDKNGVVRSKNNF